MRSYAARIFPLLALAVVMTAAPAPTSAQSNGSMTLAIPFAFTVGDRRLPAGTYAVTRLSPTASALLVQSADRKTAAAVLMRGSIQGDRGRYAARLVFDVYGDDHVLAQVWMPWSGTGTRVVTPAAAGPLLTN